MVTRQQKSGTIRFLYISISRSVRPGANLPKNIKRQKTWRYAVKVRLNREKPQRWRASDVAYDRVLWSVFSATLVICSPYSLGKSVGCLEIGKHDWEKYKNKMKKNLKICSFSVTRLSIGIVTDQKPDHSNGCPYIHLGDCFGELSLYSLGTKLAIICLPKSILMLKYQTSLLS